MWMVANLALNCAVPVVTSYTGPSEPGRPGMQGGLGPGLGPGLRVL